jgi:pimeloyl-ACP methyl ester carboxylesterase
VKKTEGFVRFREFETWYSISGDLASGRTPLLYLHGGPGGTSDGFEALDALAEEGRPIVRYDQIGGGRSDRPTDPSLWTPDTFVEELATVRRELGLERVHLLGASWGGTLAIEYMLTKPNGVTSLVLHSAPVDWPLMSRELKRLQSELPAGTRRAMQRYERNFKPRSPRSGPHKVKKRLTAKQIERSARLLALAVRLMRKSLVQAVAVKASVVPFLRGVTYQIVGLEFAQRHLLRTEEWPMSVMRSFASMNRGAYEAMWGPTEFFGLGSLKDYDRTSRLHEIDVPTLIIHGQYDSITPLQGEVLRDGIPNSELVILEDCSHGSVLEKPERYMAVLREFLSKVDPIT